MGSSLHATGHGHLPARAIRLGVAHAGAGHGRCPLGFPAVARRAYLGVLATSVRLCCVLRALHGCTCTRLSLACTCPLPQGESMQAGTRDRTQISAAACMYPNSYTVAFTHPRVVDHHGSNIMFVRHPSRDPRRSDRRACVCDSRDAPTTGNATLPNAKLSQQAHRVRARWSHLGVAAHLA